MKLFKPTTASFPRLLATGVVALAASSALSAQVSHGGTPLSWQSSASELRSAGSPSTISDVRTIAVDFNVNDSKQQNDWGNYAVKTKPLNVGHVINYRSDFAREAKCVGIIEGKAVYRLALTLEEKPVGVNLYYDRFDIPEGGKLYIYGEDGNQLLGAYTHDTNPGGGAFATEPLAGKTIVLEYEAPANGAMPQISIEGVGYFYRSVFRATPMAESTTKWDFSQGSSDPSLSKFCQVNANCSQGDEYEEVKSATVSYIVRNSKEENLGFCSGALVNNTNQDYTPYILTAGHCAGETQKVVAGKPVPYTGVWEGRFNVPTGDLAQWIFAFHYTTPHCSSGDYATESMETMVGCEIQSYLSLYGESDGMLLKLKSAIPDDYRVFYAGWDRTKKLWPKGIGFHHPAGDAMKLSTFDKSGVISTFNGQWQQGGENDEYSINFKEGNTEGGSSGSPLFNASKRLVGTLSGGQPGDCQMDALYGMVNSHWDKYKSKGELKYMSKFLDPANKNPENIDGTWKDNYKPLLSVKALNAQWNEDGTAVTLTWDALKAHEQGYEIHYNLYLNNNKIRSRHKETSYTHKVTAEERKNGSLHFAVEAEYKIADRKEKATAKAYNSLYAGQLRSHIVPTVANNVKGTGTIVTWKEPVNYQIISKSGTRSTPTFTKWKTTAPSYNWQKMNQTTKLYYTDFFRLGQSPLHNQPLYVVQIDFIPVADAPTKAAAHKLFVRKKADNAMPVEIAAIAPTGSAAKGEYVSAILERPLQVNDMVNLEVGYIVSIVNGHPQHYEIMLDSRSKDKHFAIDGSRIQALGKNGFALFENAQQNGYMALQLVLSNSPQPLKKSINLDETFTRAALPSPFPTVKSYTIYRDGQQVGTVNGDANPLRFEDPSGKADADYKVVVSYTDYPDNLRPIDAISATEAIQLYPANFSETLRLSSTEGVQGVQIFDMEGMLVESFGADALTQTLDVATLPAGSYIAVIMTSNGNITQKLVK